MQKTRRPDSRKHYRKVIIFFVSFLVIAAATVAYVAVDKPQENKIKKQTSAKANVQQPAKKAEAPKPPLIDLQPTLDTWLATQSADWSIEIYDVANQKVVASHQADTAYFTASLYKPFVAYIGYRNITNGTFVDEANYQGNRSRLTCLYEMIHSSDSPCAETMMAELGRPYIQSQLAALGATHTTFTGDLRTSAHDMNALIEKLLVTNDISNDYKQKFIDSMTTQIYRQGLAKGFTEAVVASKVGFNMAENYHESALVTLNNNGRQYIVSMLSNGQGSPRPLASFAAAMQAKLLAP